MSGGLALLALIVLSPAAMADVNVAPAQVDQGSAAAITLHVRNDRPGVFTTKVEAQFPQANPIAEIYPMSVPNWAPIATSRQLDTPIQGVHSEALTVITSAVTWIRAEDAPKAPAVEDLKLELGPMPQLDQITLTVLQTYSDGKVKKWSGPGASGTGTVLKLQPAAAAPTEAAAEDVAATVPGQGRTGVQLGLIGAGIVAGMLISAFAVVTLGNRHRPERPAEDDTEPTPEAKDDAAPKADVRA